MREASCIQLQKQWKTVKHCGYMSTTLDNHRNPRLVSPGGYINDECISTYDIISSSYTTYLPNMAALLINIIKIDSHVSNVSELDMRAMTWTTGYEH